MEKLLHPPLFVPATAKLGAVLKQMQASRTHLAFAVDEHGGMEGIVMLEEIVGEIDDEYDEEARSRIAEEADGTYLLDRMLTVCDVNRRFDLRLPEDVGYTTLAGFLLSQSGRLMRAIEVVEYEGARFSVERVERRRIRRVRITPASGGEQSSAVAGVLSFFGLSLVESLQLLPVVL